MNWRQVSDAEWIGTADWLDRPVCIEYVPKYDMYVSDETKLGYKTLQAAKIAVAKATH